MIEWREKPTNGDSAGEFDEHDLEAEVDDELRTRCPICHNRINLGMEEYCPHVLCVGGEGSYRFACDEWALEETLSELYEGCEDALDRKASLLPERLRAIAEDVVSNGPNYWRDDPELRYRRWTTDGMVGGVWQAYFHPDQDAFAARIDREARRTIAELRGA